jgi:hypothetical protein
MTRIEQTTQTTTRYSFFFDETNSTSYFINFLLTTLHGAERPNCTIDEVSDTGREVVTHGLTSKGVEGFRTWAAYDAV